MKKLLGLAALAALGYGLYLEYQRRLEQEDEWIMKIDNQVKNIVDDVADRMDAILEKAETKLDRTHDELERTYTSNR